MVLTAALTGGGVGYLLPNPALAWMALLSLPLMLIWVAGMGVWLSLGPAVSQANHGSGRQTGNPVTVACPSFRSQNPGTVRIPGRSGHRRLTGRGQTALATGNSRSALPMRNHRSLATSQNLSVLAAALAGDLVTVRPADHQGTPGQLRQPGTSARAVARTIRPVTAMSIPSPSPLRDSSTPAGDSEAKLAASRSRGGGQLWRRGGRDAIAAAVPPPG